MSPLELPRADFRNWLGSELALQLLKEVTGKSRLAYVDTSDMNVSKLETEPFAGSPVTKRRPFNRPGPGV